MTNIDGPQAAYVLAAGLGTRLRPLTDKIPKCLVPIHGRPLLRYWLDLLSQHGVQRVLVNSHHLHPQLVEFARQNTAAVDLHLVYEPVLLGSAGTLRENRGFVSDDEDFFVVYADNLSDVDLSAMYAAHSLGGKAVTLGLFRSRTPTQCGIVALNEQGTVIDFEEKPEHPQSDLAFGGVLVGSRGLMDAIPRRTPCDVGREVLPRLVGQMAGWEMGSYLRDIGTPESYALAQEEYAALHVGRP